MRAMPGSVARIRQECCMRKGCPHQLDYADPCTACPEGHFGPWMRCEGDVAPLHASSPAPAPPETSNPRGGPGTELKCFLGRLGIKAGPHCECNRRAAEMDARGADWCEENTEVIVGWLRQEAARRRLPFLAPAARAIIRKAIKRARQASCGGGAGEPQATPETPSF